MHLGEYVIRQATPFDLPIIKEFYQNNQHPYNAARGDDVLLRAIQRDRTMLLIVAPNGTIVGASAVFALLDGRFREAGATRIIENGFGFQQILHTLRAVHEYVMDCDYEAYFSTVVAGNAASIRNLIAVGFRHWPDPDADLVAYKTDLAREAGRTARIDYYHLPRSVLPSYAQRILDLDGLPRLERRSRQTSGETETITLRMDVEIVRLYKDKVLHPLAAGRDIHAA